MPPKLTVQWWVSLKPRKQNGWRITYAGAFSVTSTRLIWLKGNANVCTWFYWCPRLRFLRLTAVVIQVTTCNTHLALIQCPFDLWTIIDGSNGQRQIQPGPLWCTGVDHLPKLDTYCVWSGGDESECQRKQLPWKEKGFRREIRPMAVNEVLRDVKSSLDIKHTH